MPRRGAVPKRVLSLDARFGSLLVTRLTNKIMTRGKKSLAERIVYSALERVEAQARRNPSEVLEQAVRNATPLLQVKPRRVGGATYQVPLDVKADRGLSLAVRWLVTAARARGSRPMVEKLAMEILDAANNQGSAVKRKDDLHRMAESSRAFVHYRW